MSAGVRGYATGAGLQGGRRLERREVSERGPEWPDGSARPRTGNADRIRFRAIAEKPIGRIIFSPARRERRA